MGKSCKTLSQRNPSQNRASGVAQGVGPQFKPQYNNNNKKKTKKEKKKDPFEIQVVSYIWQGIQFKLWPVMFLSP
jgi:hypothetical protein